MGGKQSVVIAEGDAGLVAELRRAFDEDADFEVKATAADRAHLLGAVMTQRPDAVIIDTAVLSGSEAETVREIATVSPETVVVMTGTHAAVNILSQTVVAGARGFLLKPYKAEDLVATTRDAVASSRAIRETARNTSGARAARGTILTVYSPKGGVGKTTIATSLAVALAARSKQRVAIVDLSLQFGDVGVVLDLERSSSILDLVDQGDRLDESVIDEVFAKHATGVRALLAPESPGAAAGIDVTRVAKVLARLREHFAYVVCDTWPSLDELSVAALTSADRVLLVATPEVPALRDLQRVLTEIPTLRSEPRSMLVLNRYPSRVGLDLHEIERGLGRSVAITIPSRGPDVAHAVNQGLVSLASTSDAGIGPSIFRLADLLIRDLAGQRAAAPATRRTASLA